MTLMVFFDIAISRLKLVEDFVEDLKKVKTRRLWE